MRFLRFASATALAIALAGCGNSESPAAASPAAKAGPREYLPLVAEGCAAAAKYVRSDSPSFKLVSDAIDRQREIALKAAGESQGMYISSAFPKLFENAGLKDATLDWIVISAGQLTPEAVFADTPPLTVVASVGHDIEKIVSAVKAQIAKSGEEDVTIEPVDIPGAKAYRIGDNDDGAYVASVDGRLLFGAVTKERLASEVGLYVSGKGNASAAFGPFVSDKLAVAKIFIPDLGKILRAMNMGEQLGMVDSVVPNGKEIVLGLKSVDFAFNAEPGLATRIRIETSKPEDAKALESLANVALMPMLAQFQQADDADAKFAAEVLGALKIAADGAVLKVDLPLSDDMIKRGIEMAEKGSADMVLGGASALDADEDDSDDVEDND